MIVRINQFDVLHTEHYSGWPAYGRQGPLAHDWPRDAYAFELLILESDELNQPLGRNFRQSQLRHLIPEVAAALREPGELAVVRLDGPMTGNELTPALSHVLATNGEGRFAISSVEKFEPRSPVPVGSVRFVASTAQLATLCASATLGLDRAVRLRIFLVPEALVNPVLDISEADDERWNQILPRVGCLISSVRNFQSLHILTRRFNPAETKSRLSSRLVTDTQARVALPG